jgi:hypothetical protein
MPTVQVCVSGQNAGVGGSEWAADTMEVSQIQGGLTRKWKDNHVRECVWEIAQSMSIINMQDIGPQGMLCSKRLWGNFKA